ncbi:hypothetical protein, partial [Phocaeicola vulgatus]|uniref:hypothetical protein n=1 Tax=Phocaeicola vulgatus TaxID=821 RepID=UPI0039B3FE48
YKFNTFIAMFLIISEIYLFLFRTHVKVGIQKARIYVNGANLFTIDNYKIADPEAGVTRNDNNEVINSNGVLSYPLQRTITFGANITF